MRLAIGLSLVVVVIAAMNSCSSDTPAQPLAGACSINSDCSSPLVCTFQRCHNACNVSRDCPTGQRCVKSAMAGVCQLPEESACSPSSLCLSGEVCGSDLQCRMQCSPAAECAAGEYCLPSGAFNACYSPVIASDELALIAAGILSIDGSVLGDGSTVGIGPDGSANAGGPDGAGGAPDGGAGVEGDGAVTVNTCVNAQTQFGGTAQGDSNPSFTSGVGARTAKSLLIFSGYAGGDAGADNLVYVQAFDPTTAKSLGPAQSLFTAPAGAGFVLESASVAPTGQIALAFSYGGAYNYKDINVSQTTLYAAFLGAAVDAGPAGVTLQRTLELESGRIHGQPNVIWSVATGAFVFSWEYVFPGGDPWLVGTKNFSPDGQAAGGVDPVPTTQLNSAVLGDGQNQSYFQQQGSVATGRNLFGAAFQDYNTSFPSLTILDLGGTQVGNVIPIAAVSKGGGSHWMTVAATAEGFVFLYDNETGVGTSEVFVPTSGDGGVVLPDAGDAGLAGFTLAGSGPLDAHAISDDTGGLGGVGVALFYSNGLSFAYVKADGTTHTNPSSIIAHTYAVGDQMNITNFGGSFGVSLYSAVNHSTQMAASGCTR